MTSSAATTERERSLRVVEVPASDPRWDSYVRRHPRATANHLGAWAEILAKAYGFRPLYLALEDDAGALRGVMPVVYANGILSGPRLTSMPALRWAGPLAESAEDEAELMGAACERVRDGKPRRLGVVSMVPGYDEHVEGLGAKDQPPSWRLALPGDPDEYRRRLKKRFKGCYYDVKHSKRDGVTVRESSSKADLRTFYRLYLRTMRRHPAVPRPFRKMSLALELLGPEIVRLYIAEIDGRPIAGLLNHNFNGMIEVMYAASDERYLSLHPNHAVYDHAIVRAIEDGYEHFDFGGAWPHESLADFKRRWGSEPVERYGYEYPAEAEQATAGSRSLGRAHAMTVEGSDLLARVWAHAPLSVTRLAGNLIWRYA